MLKYKRALLKLSGEALAGEKKVGFDENTVLSICKAIKKCVDDGAELAIVVGGGNFWRGRSSGRMDRCTADRIGMLATVMNALYVSDMLESIGVESVVQTADSIPQTEKFDRKKAIEHLKNGKVVFFAYGTGHPFFSTDTASALRAAQTDCEIILKASVVDGVYDSDPKLNPNAVKYDEITYNEVLSKGLKVIDAAAASICRDNNIPLMVFNTENPDTLYHAISGERVGTIVKEA